MGWVGRVCLSQVQAGHALTLYNLGIRGQTIAQVAARLAFEVEARLRDCPFAQRGLVVAIGANDAAQRLPRVESLHHADALLSQAVSLAPTLMVGPAPIADSSAANEHLALLCPQLADLAARHHVPYLPVLDHLRRTSAWMDEALAGDGAHPGQGGYEALAALVAHWPAWNAWFA